MFDTITRRRSDVAIKNRILTTTVAVLAHLGVLTAVIVVPLWYFTPALPSPSEIMAFVAAPPLPPPPPPPPPPAAAPSRPARHEPVKPAPSPDRFAAPVEAPSRIEPEKLADARGTTGVLGGVEGGIEGGVVGGIVGGLSSALPPPPPPPVPPPTKPAPVHIGGQIKAPALLVRVDPVYPLIAQAAQLEGVVILEATVDETGRVESVKVLRSIRLLDAPAIEAVKQWQYSPLSLNGRPTPFVLTVTVQFHLSNRPT
jgi:protein TonB